MFDEMRTALEVALRAGARVEPAASNPNYRVGVAEIRRLLDSLEAEYGRLAAPVDASWMAQATGSTVQLAKQHAAVGAALEASPASGRSGTGRGGGVGERGGAERRGCASAV